MSRKQRAKHKSRVIERRAKRELVKNRTLFKELVELILPSGALFAKDQFHGNATWQGEQLAAQALIWTWQECKNVTDSFAQAIETCNGLGLTRIARSYTGMMNVLTNNQEVLRIGIRARFICWRNCGENVFTEPMAGY